MNEFWGLSTAAWTAIYTMITGGLLVGAVFAAMYAKRQWGTARQQVVEARRAQVEASRPYVIVAIEPSPATWHLFDLVVKNIGHRPALNVSIKLAPLPIRAKETAGHEMAKAKMLNEPVAMIAPGQEMRAFYDNHIERKGRDDLPKSHQVSIAYEDSSQHSYSETSVLDIEALNGVMSVRVRTVHDIAKSLDEMRKTFSNASLLGRSGSVEVDASIEYREDKRKRLADERTERNQQLQDMVARVQPSVAATGEEGAASPDGSHGEDHD